MKSSRIGYAIGIVITLIFLFSAVFAEQRRLHCCQNCVKETCPQNPSSCDPYCSRLCGDAGSRSSKTGGAGTNQPKIRCDMIE